MQSFLKKAVWISLVLYAATAITYPLMLYTNLGYAVGVGGGFVYLTGLFIALVIASAISVIGGGVYIVHRLKGGAAIGTFYSACLYLLFLVGVYFLSSISVRLFEGKFFI
jgi:hypothetical protein